MLAQKMRIAPGTPIVTFNAPRNYEESLGALPEGVTITHELSKAQDFVHWFVVSQSDLELNLSKVLKALKPGALLWISYPKRSSGMQTDLNRDKGWDSLMQLNLEWKSSIAFDKDWSAFLLINQLAKGPTKASADYHANQAAYIDAKNKIIHIPADLQQALDASVKGKAFFEQLSFTNRKEYVMWVVGAKRAETRTERILKSIQKLEAGKKNPSEK